MEPLDCRNCKHWSNERLHWGTPEGDCAVWKHAVYNVAAENVRKDGAYGSARMPGGNAAPKGWMCYESIATAESEHQHKWHVHVGTFREVCDCGASVPLADYRNVWKYPETNEIHAAVYNWLWAQRQVAVADLCRVLRGRANELQ